MVPLFALYAADSDSPPQLGGEMRLAIQAVNSARIVGIDAPNLSYLRTLLRGCWEGALPKSTAGAILKDLAVSLAQAMACRVGTVVGRITGTRPRMYTPIDYGIPTHALPSEQAEHEVRHVSKQRAFVQAIEVPASRRIIDNAREASMADRLDCLRMVGDVVSIVG